MDMSCKSFNVDYASRVQEYNEDYAGYVKWKARIEEPVPSFRQVCSRNLSKRDQDGFPITDVGNDG